MAKKIIKLSDLTHIQKDDRGDVKFYEDEDGKLYQTLDGGEPFPVVDGRMKYLLVKRIAGYQIEYNTNGIHGYSVWKGDTNWGDNWWYYEDAEKWVAGQFTDAEWEKRKK